MVYKLQHEELNSIIIPFVIHMLFQYFVLSCIIKNNQQLGFLMAVQINQCVKKVHGKIKPLAQN